MVGSCWRYVRRTVCFLSNDLFECFYIDVSLLAAHTIVDNRPRENVIHHFPSTQNDRFVLRRRFCSCPSLE